MVEDLQPVVFLTLKIRLPYSLILIIYSANQLSNCQFNLIGSSYHRSRDMKFTKIEAPNKKRVRKVSKKTSSYKSFGMKL